jgi:hypothetical protein
LPYRACLSRASKGPDHGPAFFDDTCAMLTMHCAASSPQPAARSPQPPVRRLEQLQRWAWTCECPAIQGRVAVPMSASRACPCF